MVWPVNYLAHLLLASASEKLLVGGWLGDFVKGNIGESYHPQIRNGILHHRKIDTYTDTHPVNLAGKKRFSRDYRRFAGIITDVTYDHFLARYWSDYCAISLSQFIVDTYFSLSWYVDTFEPRAREVGLRMIEQDWLGAYVDRRAVGGALLGVSRRLKRPNPLAAAKSEVDRLYDQLCDDFRMFFPELQAYSNQLVTAFEKEAV